jgi:primosomal protein N' (replication factor Y)
VIPIVRYNSGVSISRQQSRLFDNGAAPEPWELAADADQRVAQVVFDRPLEHAYSYLVPDELRELVAPGTRVRAPLGRGDRPATGVCVALESGGQGARRLKSITEVLDRRPLLSPQMLDLTRWMAERYLCTWGQVLNAVVPAGVRKQAGTREITWYALADSVCERTNELRLPVKQRAILDALLSAGGPLAVDEISERAGCGTAPIRALQEKGLIVPIRRRTDPTAAEPPLLPNQPDLKLNPDQNRALSEILRHLRSQQHATLLLHGVTGSGKTEVYIQAIREVVSYGRQAILLVPEISLTPQTIRRFRSRFPSVAVLHSHLSDGERHAHWEQIAQGRVQVVVGARSAVFAPTPHLGLIVIDEEHETTFKQQITPRYHAREVARERARRENIPLILGSATPTLESLLRATSGKDVLLSLPERVERRPLPPVVIVDTRNDPLIAKGHAIGRALQQSIQTAIKADGQVILFLNLRGYSTVLWCHRCGSGVNCPHCDITLTWHKDRGRVVCHNCDYEAPRPAACPSCGLPGLKYLGTGTQRLEQEVRAKFPGVSAVRMDSDAMQKPGSHDAALESFREGSVRILLGTQMIAKGLDFPNVTLVGVVDADTLLHQPDLRASERTFQLIAQVAGRTGRGEKGGRVLVQTSSPDEPVIRAAARHDYLGFAKQELTHRRELDLPPFTHLARVILRGNPEEIVQLEARRLAGVLRDHAARAVPDVHILGPAPAPILKLRNQYRYHFRLQSAEIEPIQKLWTEAAPHMIPDANVELTIDVDPLDMR